MAAVYAAPAVRRRRVVTHNLLPVLEGDHAAAEKACRRLFRNFGGKLVDLWRFELGESPKSLLVKESGWENLVAARKGGARGVLIVTPHLGNWEFGGPLLIQRGVGLHVVTQVEPGSGFTELRQAGRSRWGIETTVIGSDPFAIIEVIKRLERGEVVALLMDRPPASSAVSIDLFGRPFMASIAAAELARASGCAVVPVALPRLENGYGGHLLPEVPYDRRAMSNREFRRDFTQQIMREFEPFIRQYPDQWYHFVPIWPR